MNDSNITRAEVQAMLDVQAKSAEQLAIIARSLQDILTKEDKIHARLYNGLAKDIVAGFCAVAKECGGNRSREIEEMKKLVSGTREDTKVLKFLYGGLFGLVALAWLIVQVVQHLVKG